MHQSSASRKLWVAVGVVVALLAGAVVGAGVFFALQQGIPAPSSTPPSCPTPPPCPQPHQDPCPAPRVTVDTGELLGLCRPANAFKGIPQYAAFVGVPYAQPPLGELRFKAPRPLQPWQGVREALLFDQRCIQGPVDAQAGSEDCLHLNVYSPWLQKPQNERGDLLPVIVHVHGGTMKVGTGNIIRPDYFVAKDLVVVTFNYRLGHMGFLSLDSDLAPGNAGFKDMVAALRWVNRNIAAFGGDPDKVTVQGCSSAAASVHWLTLLPDTEGLFRGAIIKSGSAMTTWAYTDHSMLDLSSLAMAFFAKFFPNHDDAQQLHERSTLELELAFTFAANNRPRDTPSNYEEPTVALERRPDGGAEPKLILKDAEAYILEPARSRVPTIMGMTSCEYDAYGIMYLMLGQLPAIDNPALERMLPRSVIPTDFAKKALGIDPATYTHTFDEVLDDFRQQLFNVTAIDPTCDLMCRWENFFSGMLIKNDLVRSMRMHTREEKAPVYAYYYDYPIDGDCALHAHDDKVLWPEDELLVLPLNTTHSLSLNILRQVTLFSNFVKYGKPVPETDDTILPVEWTPMVKDQPDEFLRFGRNLTMDKGDLLGVFGPFWREVYNKYRGGGDAI
ncbi:juvenile hormone esterase-like [Thrips palmi]|uniref:Juvenile hormone esterase-like n=1 Tax=Thrips palmi TaxID=161013 RepID=A0A6P8ZTD4_THRPL|nr:juvenile hormone esterase-like [Thrips palmi]